MSYETDIESIKTKFKDLLSKSDYSNPNEISQEIETLAAKDADTKTIVDYMFREYLLRAMPHATVDFLKKYMHYSVGAARLELCTSNTPVVLLGDAFDMSTLEFCEELFDFVESNVAVWKEDTFFVTCKNNLLRMCNDLLRRLSRSQNTVFCGRILLFLAEFFPFSERSGLNIVSEFNLENITDFSKHDSDLDTLLEQEMDIDNVDTSKITVDYSLYSKFWCLQDFFRSPTSCYLAPKWKLFTKYSEFILSTFHTYKLDSVAERGCAMSLNSDDEKDRRYFAKFLTNQKLLELQLSDSNFRRYVLVQFLILFQYLTSTVKFKQESYELKPEQVEWIKKTKNMVHSLICETPPDGPEFAKTVQNILMREERWNTWKNEGCPEIKKPNSSSIDFKCNSQKRPLLGDILRDATKRKKYYMGHTGLTKLWNQKPDNLEACRSKERNFLPSLEKYFEPSVMESDPVNMIEQQYKKVNDMDYAWRGLRLLSQKCSFFFSQVNNPIHNIPDYLENILNRVMKDKPVDHGSMEVKSESVESEMPTVIISADGAEEAEVIEDSNKICDEKLLDEERDRKWLLKKEQIEDVAKIIVSDWKTVARNVGFNTDEIDYFANEGSSELDGAQRMVRLWIENDEDMTRQKLTDALVKLGYKEIEDLFSTS